MVCPLLTKHTFSGLTTASLKVWTKKSELHESLHILFPEKKSFWAMHHPIFLFGEKTLFSQNPPINCLEKKNGGWTNHLLLTTQKNRNWRHSPPTILLHAFPGLTNVSLKVWTKNVLLTNPSTIPIEKKRRFERSPSLPTTQKNRF